MNKCLFPNGKEQRVQREVFSSISLEFTFFFTLIP